MVDTFKSFETLINQSDKPVLADFWADWCGPCHIMAPVIEQIAKAYSGRLTVIKVNVDEKLQIAQKYDIRGIPTVMLFWQGQPLMRVTGARSFEQLKQEIEQYWPAGIEIPA
ncbi:MAG: thioredoxin [Candidatus Heimdallarchaeota archaeon]|nr:thioredoxin [Candidatus Heimdallarchaeota archaeon]